MAIEDFGAAVWERAFEVVGVVIAGQQVLAYTEIGQFEDVVSTCEEQVGRLQIGMDYSLLVDKLERKAELKEEAPDLGLAELDNARAVEAATLLIGAVSGSLQDRLRHHHVFGSL